MSAEQSENTQHVHEPANHPVAAPTESRMNLRHGSSDDIDWDPMAHDSSSSESGDSMSDSSSASYYVDNNYMSSDDLFLPDDEHEEKSLVELIRVALDMGTGDPSGEDIDWDAVISRAKSHPEEAKVEVYDFDCGYLCLHIACTSRDVPMEAIEALLHAYPEAIHRLTDDGSTLNLACENNTFPIEAIRLLIRKEKELTAKRDVSVLEEGPIWWADSSELRKEVIMVLLQEYALDVARHHDPLGSAIEYFKPNHQAYDFLCLFLMAFDHETIDATSIARNGATFQPLHALLRHLTKHMYYYKTCGFMAVLQLMEVNSPALFSLRDFKGLLPLQVIIESKRRELEGSAGAVNVSFLNNVIAFLIRMNPESASSVNSQGRMPLHIAIENGWPVDSILEAAPHVVNAVDVETRLYPFQAATAAGTERVFELARNDCEKNATKMAKAMLNSVDLTYRLLRQDPMVIL